MSKKEKKNKKFPSVIYYTDELNDEFSRAVITPKAIDENYKYKRDKGLFGRLAALLAYRIAATPIAFIYLKLKFRHSIVGREKLKGQGAYFIYGNHTQETADALIPTFISMPKRAYVIVHPNNVSMPFLGRITPYMGALPLPDNMKAARNFSAAIKERIAEGSPVFIYPEAHIWPYYTGIRGFVSDSFSYPLRYGVPTFCFTNTYSERGKGKVKMTTYIDGPFFPNTALSPREQREELRDAVYECMKQRAALSSVEIVAYRPKPDRDLK